MIDLPLDLPSIEAHDAQPLTAENPPYQQSIVYRAEDYSSLRYYLLLHLQDAFPQWNALAAQNQGEQDFGVTFVELFSYVADILGFYQNSRANEAFLRTATLPGSLIELCRLIDYRIGPGVSAASFQAFFCKDGTSGTVPAGFAIKTQSKNGQPPLVFETSSDLAASSDLNVLHLKGYDRSEEVLSAAVVGNSLLLDQSYAGLTAGSFVVITDAQNNAIPIQLTAVTDEGTERRISWKPGDLPANLDSPIADVKILGKPKQKMQLDGAAAADSIAAGESSAAVEDPSVLNPNRAAVFVSPGFKQVTVVLSINGSVISWAPTFGLPLRRSETTVYYPDYGGELVRESIAIGDQSLWVGSADLKPDTTIVLRDYYLQERSTNVQLARIANSDGYSTYYLAEPLTQAFPNGAYILTLTDQSRSTTLLPVRLSDIASDCSRLTLDRTYDGLLAGQTVVITDGGKPFVETLVAVEVDSQQRTVLTLSSSYPDLIVATTNVYGPFDLQMYVDGYNRSTATLPAGTTQITLDGTINSLAPGRYLILEDTNGAEAVRIAAIAVNNGNTDVDLQTATSRSYAVADASVFGNVVEISEGQSVTENPLGSGDQSQANQVFQLHQKPTTYVHDPQGDRGASNTLEVFVGNEEWTEVESLAESGPSDHHIMTEIDENQAMSFMGGDSHHGAAFPTGRNNISARYRTGMGAAGNVDANAISVMPAPLPFVLSSRNPVASAGGADPDNQESTRQLAQLMVRTLDRAVSIQDFQDLALTYSGISKASATLTRVDGRAAIVLVVATTGGLPLPDSLRRSLAAFISDRSAPGQVVVIRDYKPFPVHLSIEVHVRANYLRGQTGVLVQQTLGTGTTQDGTPGYFNFDQRGLGENLYLSDVYALVEAVDGVEFLIVTEFRAEANVAASGVAQDVIQVPADSVATGGDPLDPTVGILSLKLIGGIA